MLLPFFSILKTRLCGNSFVVAVHIANIICVEKGPSRKITGWGMYMNKVDENYTDQELVLRLQNDDEEAYQLIYNRYWSALFGNAFNRVRDKEISQDIVQDVFLDVWRRRRSLNPDNLSAYLHAATRFITYRRMSKMPIDTIYFKEFEQALVSSFFAEDRLLKRELNELLDKWILALPKKRRKIFLLHFNQDMSTEEIANQLGIARKTVQNQLTVAYREIQQKYARFLAVVILGWFV